MILLKNLIKYLIFKPLIFKSSINLIIYFYSIFLYFCVNNILKIKPKKIVYISCNPATLIRDLTFFENQYDIRTIVPVDMFPFTSNVECVSVMCIK